ncbi:MAG TPA: outer membrane protein [Xanthobacteraceae bacterium]|nr:outer membrane protein [Xanthobacteraceae bacterium]
MKKLIAASAAFIAFAAAGAASAADMALKAPPVAPVPEYDWTGGYVGINGGYSWGRSSTNVTFYNSATGVAIVPPPGSITSSRFNLDGGIVGGQIGYNLQSGRWVFGLETDLQWSGERGNTYFLCAATATGGVCLPGSTFLPAGATGAALSLSQSLEWFGTARGRLGVTLVPSVLAYVTGGLAYGSIKTSGNLSGFNPGGVASALAFTNSTTKAGWTLGGGLETRLADRWTGKIEYLYADYGTVSGMVVNTVAGIGANYSSRVTDNVLRVGVNYHFSGR